MKKSSKVIALVIALMLCIGILPMSALAVSQDEALAWLNAQDGAYYDLDGKNGAQCSDFVSAYMNWLYSGQVNPDQGYGVYNANYYPTVAGWNTARWEVIQNYGAFVPQPGDIFVSKGTASVGHTGVVISSDVNNATVIDQNSISPNDTTGHAAYIHRISWTKAYSPTYFIRFKEFSTAPVQPAAATAPKAQIDRGQDGIYYVGESGIISLSGDSSNDYILKIYRTPTGGETYLYWEGEIFSTQHTVTFTQEGYYSCCFTVNPWGASRESEWVGWSVLEPQPSTVSQRYQGSDWAEGWYEGEWSNGKPNGYGKLTYDDFEDGKFISLDTDGTSYKAISYEGYFVDGWRDGSGVTTYEGGYREEGTFYGKWSAGKTVFEGKRWKTTDESEGYWPLTMVAIDSVYSDDRLGEWVYTKAPKAASVEVTNITLDVTSVTMKIGDSVKLTAIVSPDNATDKAVSWTSSNPATATVSDGKVTAVAEGNAVITASAGGKTATCTVTVKADATKPTITSASIPNGMVGTGYNRTLTANGTAPITWLISSGALPDGLSLNSASGLISGTPTKAGTFSFTVTAENSAGAGQTSLLITVSEKKAEGSEVHFERVTVYYQDQFTDVPADQWYTGSVANAFELGLMKGNSVDTFNPYGDVTVAEAITMAARIHSIYSKGTENFDQSVGGAWYQTYLDYALANGIISRAYYNSDVTHKASRAQFAEIFSNSLPAEALAAINNVADNAIPDVKMTDSFAEFVYKLYRAGILTGSDANGTFNPQTFITRAEAAAIVSRMAESNNRVQISLG